MRDLRIKRFENHPHEYQGAVVPEDGRWQLVVDKEGNPHLFVRVFAKMPDGTKQAGLVLLDHFLSSPIADIIDGEAEGDGTEPTDEEVQEILAKDMCPAL